MLDHPRAGKHFAVYSTPTGTGRHTSIESKKVNHGPSIIYYRSCSTAQHLRTAAKQMKSDYGTATIQFWQYSKAANHAHLAWHCSSVVETSASDICGGSSSSELLEECLLSALSASMHRHTCLPYHPSPSREMKRLGAGMNKPCPAKELR
jgi:hypothetical protein